MGSLEKIGSTDPHNERKAAEAQKDVLEEIEAEIGTEKYREIIAALLDGNVDDLPDDLKAVVEKIKRQRGSVH